MSFFNWINHFSFKEKRKNTTATVLVILISFVFMSGSAYSYEEDYPKRGGFGSFLFASVGSFFKSLVFQEKESSQEEETNNNIEESTTSEDNTEQQQNTSSLSSEEEQAEEQSQRKNMEETISSIQAKYDSLQRELNSIKSSGLTVNSNTANTPTQTIERTIERVVSGISKENLDSEISSLKKQLENINTNLLNQISVLSAQTSSQTSAVYKTISLTNKIDNLSNVSISNATVSGITGLTDSDIPDTVTASSYLPLSGGTMTGNILMPASAYLNFGSSSGTDGYGFRDNGGTLQIKNSSGSWSNIPTSGSTQWTTNGDNIYYTTGNIGIGTTSPYWKLSVAGMGSFDDSVRASYFTATSTTKSTFPYASTTALTVSGNSYLGTVSSGTWNGTAIGDAYIDDTITLTNLTQVTNRAITDTTGTLTVARGGTGQTSFSQGWLHSDGTTLTASTSPTIAWLTATSTTATSTFAGGLSVTGTGTGLNFGSDTLFYQNDQRFLTSSTTSAGNLTIGYQSPTGLDANGGLYNTGLGYQALGNATSTGYNTAIGYQALKGSATVSNTGNNMAVGYKALTANTTGYYNTALGNNSLYTNTTGYYNTALGNNSLYTNTTGYFNTALGQDSLRSNTTGYSNSALGKDSLYTNTTGYFNSALGQDSGRFIANGSTANQTSNNSLYLGYNTKALADGDTNEIVIGASNTGLGSNTVVLGNSSIVTTALRGNIGIGTTTPNSKLTVYNGSADSAIEFSSASGDTYKWTMGMDYSDAGKFKIASSTALGSVDRFTIDGNGRIGIGTSTPGTRLDVAEPGNNNAQIRITRESDIYTDFSVAQTTGDLSMTLNGGSANDFYLYQSTGGGGTGANLWVCEGTACPAATLADGGNIVVERDIKYPTSGRMKRSIVLTASGGIVPTSGGATKSQVDTATSSYYVLDFGNTSTTSAFWQWTIPDSYDGGNITATHYWFTTGTSGGVSWCVQYNGVNTSENINSDLSSATCDSTSSNVPGTASTLATTTQTLSSSLFTPGEVVTLKTSRGVDNSNDTLSANARLYMVKIEYGVATESD